MAGLDPRVVELGNDVILQYGCAPKNVSHRSIDFADRFAADPVVFASSFIAVAGTGIAQVGATETVHFVDEKRFELFSGNAAPNYFVNWLAIGPRSGASEPYPTEAVFGPLLIQWGSQHKESHRFQGDFCTNYAVPPTLILTPYWKNVPSHVGHHETISSITTSNFSAVSGNQHRDFLLNWLAAGPVGPSPVTIPRTPPLTHFSVNEHVIKTGSINKTIGSLGFGFVDTSPNALNFTLPDGSAGSPLPVVLLSHLLATGEAVSAVDTLNAVNTSTMLVTGANRRADYFTTFLAIGI